MSTHKSSHKFDKNELEFDQIISNRFEIIRFRKFLEKEFCQENLDFYIDVQKYKKLPLNLMKIEASRLFKKYIEQDSISQVNISYDTVEHIKKNLNTPSNDIFANAEEEILQLLHHDCYKRFVASKNNTTPKK